MSACVENTGMLMCGSYGYIMNPMKQSIGKKPFDFD